jgi:superfamily I DNA/RNA helicase
VRTLPVVLGELYRRMSPDTADRVEFTGLHQWATKLLRDRGVDYRLDWGDITRSYAAAWSQVGKKGPLARLDVPWDYWKEEIDYVIKGRGLTSFDQYAELVRVGRRTRLLPEHRRAMWDLYRAYEQQLAQLSAHDFNDVLLLALQEIRRDTPGPYVAVVVDEVQDLNRVGVQLLHALVGDAPDGLLLIGDGQQCVYPGGFTLAEAGIAVTGRSTVLRVNYRNTREILDTATALVAGDRFQDLDDLDELGRRDLEVARSGPRPIRVAAADIGSHDTALLQMIRDTATMLGVSWGDLAVLAATTRRVSTYQALLQSSGVPCIELESYDGRSTDKVKVGTFKRAKGLEFKYVFLPQLADGPSTQWVEESESAHRERVERERRELFVGMTRARDGLWLGFVR